MKSFGNLVRELRNERGYFQRELAERLNTSTSMVADWECDWSNPSRPYVDRFIQVFPDCGARLYVAARLLPLRPGTEARVAQMFGELLKAIRDGHNYRQSDLAEAIGVNPTTVSYWETGRHIPSRLHIEDLAECFRRYQPALYVTARLLPVELNAARERAICSVLEEVIGDTDATIEAHWTSTISDLL